MSDVKRAQEEIDHPGQKGQKRQPAVFSPDKAEVLFQNNEICQRIQAVDEKIDKGKQPAVLFLPVVVHDAAGKGLCEEMQVVCQKAQRQKNAEDDQKGIEARQRLVLRVVDQDGQEEAQKGLREHGEIHGVPQIPLRCDLTGEHLVTEDLQNKLQEQADGDPQHQGAQPAVCDTLPHGDRPEKRQHTAKQRRKAEGEILGIQEDAEKAAQEKRSREQNDILF